MIDKDGKFEFSPLRAINNNNSFDVTIYPNPAKDQLQVQVSSNRKIALQMQVLSPEGKVLSGSGFSVDQGSFLRSINISLLPEGNYFLKITSSEKEENLIEFVKI